MDYGNDGVDRTEAFIYDGDQIALAFGDDDDATLAAGDLEHRYLWGPAVDQLLADEAVTSLGVAGLISWTLGDHQHTVRDVVQYISGTTNLVNHNVYDSFGNKLSQSAPAHDVVFGYTGRYVDPDTGLQWNGSTQGGGRWYDPQTGRWLSEDSIGFAGDPSNVYRYVENAATMYADPTGMVKPLPPGNEHLERLYRNGGRFTARDSLTETKERNDLISSLNTLIEGTDAAGAGLGTGAKAVVNGCATAVKNTVTLGLSPGQLELIGVTKEDRERGYDTAVAIATASGEILVGVATGGAASALANGGRVARTASGALAIYDAAGNMVGVVTGTYDAATNGLNLQNGSQILGGALGLGGNAQGLRRPRNAPETPNAPRTGASSPIPGSYINKKNCVDMTKAPPGSAKNAAGFPRNGPWFWRQMLEQHPEMFSDANRAAIRGGRAPTVDDDWIKHNPTHQSFSGETLVHHHIDQGAIATPLPESVHQDYHGILHPE